MQFDSQLGVFRHRARVIGALILVVLFLIPAIAFAIQVPPEGSLFFVQTNGATDPINDGDWYGSNANGAGAGYHYLEVNVPCGWSSALPIHFDLFSPMMFTSNNGTDEPGAGGPYSTTFEIYGLATTVRPSASNPHEPGPGATGSLFSQTFNASASSEQWFRFYTLATPTCGKYLVRAETRNGDQNGWKLRVGSDSDSNPNNAPDVNYDNSDGVLGTNDELTIGIFQAAYQQDSGLTQCLTLYQFVQPNQSAVAFHNFDGDWVFICGQQSSNCRVRYYAPSDVYDANAYAGGTVGAFSDNGVWNTGTTTNRGAGDVINTPEAGWWRIVSCISNHNQFIQEGQTAQTLFYTVPATPKMILSDTDYRTITSPNQVMTYTLTFTNTSNATSTPGAATNIRITDTLDLTRVDFQACGYNAPYAGTCSLIGSDVVFTPTGWINAGANYSVWVRVQTKSNVNSGSVTNTATLTYRDSLANLFPDVIAVDVDNAAPTAVTLTQFSARTDRAIEGLVAIGMMCLIALVLVFLCRSARD